MNPAGQGIFFDVEGFALSTVDLTRSWGGSTFSMVVASHSCRLKWELFQCCCALKRHIEGALEVSVDYSQLARCVRKVEDLKIKVTPWGFTEEANASHRSPSLTSIVCYILEVRPKARNRREELLDELTNLL